MDWKSTLAEIQEFGHLTQPQIAAIVGCGQATISGLMNGTTKEPRYSLGESIKALHLKVKAEASTETSPQGA